MRDELFRALGIPYLRSSELQLKAFFNAALVLNNSESPSLPESQKQEFKHPFYEVGFGIGHVLIPLQIEFAWKLNYRGENNFRIGINSVVI
jgi:outer membrane protein assembly factor BamA